MTKKIANIRLKVNQYENYGTVGVTFDCVDDGQKYGEVLATDGKLTPEMIVFMANSALENIDDFVGYVPPVKMPKLINVKEDDLK